MIEWQVLRIQQSRVESIILATSDDESDDELADVVGNLGIDVFRGSLSDVHSRFLRIIEHNTPNYFIRLTGDCPVVMPSLINDMMAKFESDDLDYLSNIKPPTYPDGLDIEVISSKSFLEFSKKELTQEEKEHVTLGMRNREEQFKIGNFENDQNFSRMRWTVDYEEDFNFVRNVFNLFSGQELHFTMSDILRELESGTIANNSVSYKLRNVSLNKGASDG